MSLDDKQRYFQGYAYEQAARVCEDMSRRAFSTAAQVALMEAAINIRALASRPEPNGYSDQAAIARADKQP